MTHDELIKQAHTEKWDVCIYGLGYLGQKLYKEVPDMLGLKVGYYCDGSNKKVDEVRLPGIRGVYKSELLRMDHSMLVLIMVDDPYDKEIKNELSVIENLHPITLRELTGTQLVIREFYGDAIYKRIIGLQGSTIVKEL